MAYSGIISIRVIQARNLPKADVLGGCDAFFTFKIGSSEAKTTTKSKTQNPSYNETLNLSYEPTFNTKVILVTLYDEDAMSNDKLGSITIPFEEFTNKKVQKWWPISDEKGKSAGEVELEIIFNAAGAPGGAYGPQDQNQNQGGGGGGGGRQGGGGGGRGGGGGGRQQQNQGGYNQGPPPQQGGYGNQQQGGYNQGPPQQGGYGNQQQGGYNQQQGGYNQGPPPQQGGYGNQQQGGYNQGPPPQQGGYNQGPPQQNAPPPARGAAARGRGRGG